MSKDYTDYFPVWPLMIRPPGETIEYWKESLEENKALLMAPAMVEWEYAKENGYLLN